MENILTNLLSSLVSGADSVINYLLTNLMEIAFYAERTMFSRNIVGVTLTIDNLKNVILSFAISLIILKFLKKRF